MVTALAHANYGSHRCEQDIHRRKQNKHGAETREYLYLPSGTQLTRKKSQTLAPHHVQ